MSAPVTYAPTTSRVALAWARLAVPDITSDVKLPGVPDATMRTKGYLQIRGAGGRLGLDAPMRMPVVTFACWVAPPREGSDIVQANAAEQLATRVINTAYDRSYYGSLDLSGLGAYRPVVLHSVQPLTEPLEVPDDPAHFARVDLDVAFTWTGV